MKIPVVDYRTLRLKNLNCPQFQHLKLLLWWAVYFLLYYLTESMIPAEACHVIHCALDDRIPFCEWFVLFYAGWYLLILGSLGYFLLYSVESFRKLQMYIILVQLLATLVYILYPSRQELRPEVFPRENLLTAMTASFIGSIHPPGSVHRCMWRFLLALPLPGCGKRRPVPGSNCQFFCFAWVCA